ncbi:glutathione S-transferase [Xanthomonas sacchari]|nr:glutathione S-transferase [Xanthomonas sacchari]
MLTILGNRTSINVRKVHWACIELALPFRQQDVDTPSAMATPVRRGSAMAALNPNGMVPVLLDDDFVLWESNSILRYLANRYGDGALYAVEAKARARVDQWLDWQASDLNGAWRYAFLELVRGAPHPAEPAQIQASLAAWAKCMAVLDRRLADTGAYVAGEHFSLADIAIGLSVHRWYRTPFEHPPLQAVDTYYRRLSDRAGFLVQCADVA